MRNFLNLSCVALALAATPAAAQDDATTTPVSGPSRTTTTQSAVPAGPATPATPAAPATDATASTSAPPVAATTSAASSATSLSAEQRAAYEAWPAETKTYFDALPPGRQQLFLRITDNDKGRLVALPAAQQESVWTSLERQATELKAKAK